MNINFNNKLIVTISALVIIIVFYLAIDLHQTNSKEALTQFSNYETFVAQQLNHQMESYIKRRERGLLVLSRFGSIQFQDSVQLRKDIQAYFNHLQKMNVREICLLNKKGLVIFSTRESINGKFYPVKDFWQWVVQKKNKNQFLLKPIDRTSISNLQMDGNTPKTHFLLIKPVYQEIDEAGHPVSSGEFLGAILLDLNLEQVLKDQLSSLNANLRPARVSVLDRKGILLLSTEHPDLKGKNTLSGENCQQCHHSLDPLYRLIHQKQGILEYESIKEERQLTAFVPLKVANTSWITAISVPQIEILKFVSRNLFHTFLLIAIVALTITAGSYLLYRNTKHVIMAKEQAKYLKERQSLMEAIEESKNYLESILNSSSEMICTLQRDGSFRFINPQMEKITGYTKDEFAKMQFSQLVPPRQLSTWRTLWKDVLEGKTGTYEIEIKKKNRQKITCLFSQSLVKGFDEILVFLKDVTHRRQMEEQIKRSKEFVETVLNSIPEAISIIDTKGFKIVGCNQVFLDQYGLTQEEVLGKCCYLITHKRTTPCSPPDDFCPLSETVKHKKHSIEEHIHYDANGNKFYVEVSASPIRNKYGDIERIVYIARDITERKQVEKKQEVLYNIAQATNITNNLKELLRTLHQQLGGLMDTTNFFVALYDKDTDMYSFPYFVDQHDEGKDFPPQKLRKSMTDYVRRTGKPLLVTAKDIHKLTQQGEVELVGTPSPIWMGVPLKTLQEVIGVVVVQSYTNPSAYTHRDLDLLSYVSDNIAMAIVRKRSEEKRIRLLKELESVNRELKDFAYVVSHDLKAPLRAIGSLANWLSSDYKDQLDDEGRELIQLLDSRVKRMHDLIEGILQYSRLGRVREEMVTVNLNQIVPAVIDLLSPPAHISVKVETELPIITMEKTRIEQVFQNLINNAIKYMDKEKGEIRIGCEAEDGYWKFRVSDNGPGIEEKYFSKIFQIFQTLKPRDEYESTGVGLTLVKKIIEMYGGKIWLESEVGKGTTFYFTLPQEGTNGKFVEKGNEEQQAYTIS